MRPLTRLALALGIALLLPFPGPHVDGYLPIGGVLFRRDALGADAGFFVMAGVLIAVYTAVVFAVLLLVRKRTRG
jgi:hypothetical protein